MKRKDLETQFGTLLPLTLEQWAFAWLLGRARQQANTSRAATSNRGRRGNQQVDLHGALGELLLYGMASNLPNSADALAYMRRQLFRATGGDRDGVDGYSIEDSRKDVYSKQEVHNRARNTGEGSPIARLARLLPEAEPYLTKAQATL